MSESRIDFWSRQTLRDKPAEMLVDYKHDTESLQKKIDELKQEQEKFYLHHEAIVKKAIASQEEQQKKIDGLEESRRRGFENLHSCLDKRNCKITALQATISENKKTLEEIFSIVAQRDPQILTHKQACDAVEEICSKYFRGVCL